MHYPNKENVLASTQSFSESKRIQDVLECDSEKELRNKQIYKAIFTNRKSRILIEDKGDYLEKVSQIVDSTTNHIFLNNGENIPKRSVLRIEPI